MSRPTAASTLAIDLALLSGISTMFEGFLCLGAIRRVRVS